jgi:magnesium-transporting ATPase (P-type)
VNPIAIVISFFLVLAVLVGTAAFAQRKLARWLSALAAFGWACLMFVAAGWAESLNHNVWYSSAASKMLNAYIAGIQQGRQNALLNEMKQMSDELDVTYERRGNFKELAERAAERLAKTNSAPVGTANPK